MKKKLTTNDILDELNFTSKEKETFIKCIQFVKDEFKNDAINAVVEMENIIKGVVEDEI